MSLGPVLGLIEPGEELDLSPILKRPSPFLGDFGGGGEGLLAGIKKRLGGDGKGSRSEYSQGSMPLERKQRNAKTVDFFKTN